MNILSLLILTPILSASATFISLAGGASLINWTGESAASTHFAVPSLAQPNPKQRAKAKASRVVLFSLNETQLLLFH